MPRTASIDLKEKMEWLKKKPIGVTLKPVSQLAMRRKSLTNSANPSRSRCRRCGGRGYIHVYAHVMAGVCFSCWGNG